MNLAWSALSALTGNLVRTRGSASACAIYLTFDDGPDAQYTPAMLDLLGRHDAKGTFFLTGNQVRQRQDLSRRILDEGHAIGNHSMSHPRMETLSASKQWAEVEAAESALRDIDGLGQHMLRPPHGRLTASLLMACLARRRRLMLWSVDSLDYREDAAGVVSRLRSRPPRPGDVILFHDDSPVAAEALAELLPEWRRAGFRFPVLS